MWQFKKKTKINNRLYNRFLYMDVFFTYTTVSSIV